MNNTDHNPGPEPGAQAQGSGRRTFFKNGWFWVGIIVLLGGFVIYVRTWTQATHLDFKPETHPPPPTVAPAQR
jgi:hypothetical protein